MPSLYHHEKLSHDYADEVQFPEDRLVQYAVELNKLRETTVIPRQLGQIASILDLLEFEVRCRLEEDGTVSQA